MCENAVITRRTNKRAKAASTKNFDYSLALRRGTSGRGNRPPLNPKKGETKCITRGRLTNKGDWRERGIQLMMAKYGKCATRRASGSLDARDPAGKAELATERIPSINALEIKEKQRPKFMIF